MTFKSGQIIFQLPPQCDGFALSRRNRLSRTEAGLQSVLPADRNKMPSPFRGPQGVAQRGKSSSSKITLIGVRPATS
jgi:hypothetical protein